MPISLTEGRAGAIAWGVCVAVLVIGCVEKCPPGTTTRLDQCIEKLGGGADGGDGGPHDGGKSPDSPAPAEGGVCSMPDASEATSCDDGNACTKTDTCSEGVCTGTDPVICTALDDCHTVGECDTASGRCSNPARADDFVCGTNKVCKAGSCVCQPDMTPCDGVCVDLSSDRANCGACGHGCFSGGCSSGKCQPYVVEALSGDCQGLASDGKDVVWLDVDKKSVRQKSALGGDATPIVLWQAGDAGIDIGSGSTGSHIVVANNVVTWNTVSPPATMWQATEGVADSGVRGPGFYNVHGYDTGAAVGVSLNPAGSAAYLAVLDYGTTPDQLFTIQRCSFGLSGCLVVTAASGFYGAGQGIAVNSRYVFWTDGTVGDVGRWDFKEMERTYLAVGLGTPTWLEIDSKNVYWVVSLGTTSFSIGRALQEVLDGGMGDVVQATSLGTVNALVTDGKYLYYGGALAKTNIGYVSVSATGATEIQALSTGGAVPVGALAAAGGKVIWYDSKDKTIYAIAAPL